MQSYIDQISNLTNPTFQGLRRIANRQLSHLSGVERDKLIDVVSCLKVCCNTQPSAIDNFMRNFKTIKYLFLRNLD